MPRPRFSAARSLALSIAFCSMFASSVMTAAEFDYFAHSRETIRNGVQAVLTCNGLYTSNRSMAQIQNQELRYINGKYQRQPSTLVNVADAEQAVTVGGGDDGVAVTAVYREGLGCVVLAPNQSVTELHPLPTNANAIANDALKARPWPLGDQLPAHNLTEEINHQALESASKWAFDRPSEEQDTLSLLVVYKGQIVYERYADGITKDTKTRTWSTAKSIASALIGVLVDQGELELDAPLKLTWLPALANARTDPRRSITLRHLLHMSSGLEPVDSFNQEYATGSGLAYWAGASSAQGALKRGLVRAPGTVWEYENYDTLLAVMAMRAALQEGYHRFPYSALLHKLGMFNTVLSTDQFGDFILSSQVYTNARDLARFGLLYLQNGQWQGEQLLSTDWIKFTRTPAPASRQRHSDYGAHWWLVPTDRRDMPPDAYATAGNRGQYVIVVPSHELVIVRRGLDWGRQGFDRWDLAREVIKAFPRNSP